MPEAQTSLAAGRETSAGPARHTRWSAVLERAAVEVIRQPAGLVLHRRRVGERTAPSLGSHGRLPTTLAKDIKRLAIHLHVAQGRLEPAQQEGAVVGIEKNGV